MAVAAVEVVIRDGDYLRNALADGDGFHDARVQIYVTRSTCGAQVPLASGVRSIHGTLRID